MYVRTRIQAGLPLPSTPNRWHAVLRLTQAKRRFPFLEHVSWILDLSVGPCERGQAEGVHLRYSRRLPFAFCAMLIPSYLSDARCVSASDGDIYGKNWRAPDIGRHARYARGAWGSKGSTSTIARRWAMRGASRAVRALPPAPGRGDGPRGDDDTPLQRLEARCAQWRRTRTRRIS
ncbi:hypothetical protein DFH06DRAFT_379335 [Mycena polygramma]|nr:hypothetical protein DFH06DRAFT_379335 [Mycena polygramma]